MIKTIRIIIATVSFISYASAQPSWYAGTIIFKLNKDTIPGIENLLTNKSTDFRELKFMSPDQEGHITYDTLADVFKYSTKKGYNYKSLAIIYKSDTIYINFPSIEHRFQTVSIGSAIPLSNISYSFYDDKIVDVMVSNGRFSVDSIFYLCKNCSLLDFKMEEKELKRLKRQVKKWNLIAVSDSIKNQKN
jgi:hypothetical protein